MPRRQVRIALVIEGGVSLAVWMSGVVNTISPMYFRRVRRMRLYCCVIESVCAGEWMSEVLLYRLKVLGKKESADYFHKTYSLKLLPHCLLHRLTKSPQIKSFTEKGTIS